MTALTRVKLPHLKVFGNAKSSTWGHPCTHADIKRPDEKAAVAMERDARGRANRRAPMRSGGIAGHRNLTGEALIYAAATVASLQELCAAVRNCRYAGRLIKCRCTLNVL
jgi:hypothetical protein